MFLAALCAAVVPAGHSYFPLVVLAEEGNRNNPFWTLVTLPVCLIPSSALSGWSILGPSAIAVTRVQAAWSGWPWAGVMWPLRIQFHGCQRLNVTALQGHFQGHYL